ncbi:polymorphic toxin-type HINT domain-containing protein [Streptomyces sp. NPDC020801]|uniref:polymorphic toxin-type HINT domain-containing protein n=1 Tax=unclassified Streptomyces TaxID=2593676 RepID=UPI00379B2483
MQRLLNEADGIAASARKDSWLAAKAAATAKNAKDEANKAAAQAQKSADQAGKYAADAKKSADQAQDSANQAATSAKTARNASDRADQDAADADESASQAEWSATYARDSAHAADDAADDAQNEAVAAGKSAEEAKTEASKAWSDAVTKRRAEEAAARRQAEEQRKQQREKEQQAKNKKRCVAYMTRDNLPPCALAGQRLELPETSPDLAKLLLQGGMEVLGITDLLDCAKNPTLGKRILAVAAVLPIGKLRLLKKAADGVEDIAEASRAAKAAEAAEKCLKCFLAGTKVLMADGSTKNIESVKVGDSVTATDPLTGVTGPRAVTDTIVTEHDKQFDELTLHTRHGTEHLTATSQHPFWSPSSRNWVKAGDLSAGAALRTVDGTQVTVQSNRFFEETARTFNLSVAGLHTYYVLAGETPVLVHNSGGCLVVLRNWQSQRFQFGSETFLLDKKGFEHILTRHHPKYWDGSVKQAQSFFDPNMSVEDVQNAIGEVMKQNRDVLMQRGSKGMYQISGEVNGVEYVLGMNRGRVGQLYPKSS